MHIIVVHFHKDAPLRLPRPAVGRSSCPPAAWWLRVAKATCHLLSVNRQRHEAPGSEMRDIATPRDTGGRAPSRLVVPGSESAPRKREDQVRPRRVSVAPHVAWRRTQRSADQELRSPQPLNLGFRGVRRGGDWRQCPLQTQELETLLPVLQLLRRAGVGFSPPWGPRDVSHTPNRVRRLTRSQHSVSKGFVL